ncbi:MAG: leucine-rich repeat domain-containing protein [Prevotella sp.]|nr:leucine-rich repeat domain-containing protein [Prevotella sp.]
MIMRKITFLLTIVLMSMTGIDCFAYDIAVENEDGVTIYYNFINDNTELEVTYGNSKSNSYTGTVIIPEEVTYNTYNYRVTAVGYSAFNACWDLISANLPNSVTSIEKDAFNNCKNLTTINFPCNLKSIGGYAFYSCSNITSITIPKSLTSIGIYAFSGCNGLKKVIVEDISAWCNISFHGITIGSTNNPLYFAHHLYSDENTEITNLVIPDGVTKIGSRAFQGCHGLTSITLPNSVTSIGDFAFSCCEGFTTITVPSNITFGEYVFSMCSGLTTAIISEGVTTIGNGMFSACKNLNSIIIPSSVSTIKQDAFNGCNNLTKVIVKDISAYCKVKYENFASNPLRYSHRIYSDEATEITDLIIPANVETIENCVFSFCSGLKSVTIPSTVKTIGIQSFEDCVGLTSLTIEDGVKTIGTYAFFNCINLTSVTIPGSANIGPAAFEDCKGLTTLNFMNGVETIGYNAFYGCTGITSVTFPSSMTSIDSRAFNDIDLLSVTSLLTEPFEIEGKESDYYKVFSSNTFENATLYVPEGTIEKYKTTKGWKDFHHIVEGIPSGINSVSTSAKATEKERYNLNGERLSKPLRGVNIIRMSDGTTKKVVVK